MAKRRRLNRDIIIDMASEMADTRRNAEVVSLAALARALEVRPPSLYNHVASLYDLRAGMAEAGLRQLVSDLRQASLGLVGREAITAMAAAYRRFAHAHPGIYPLTLRAPEPGDTALSTLSQELVQMMLLMMASLGLEGDDAIHAIRGLRALLHGFATLEEAGGFKLPQDADESFRRLVNAYLNGAIG